MAMNASMNRKSGSVRMAAVVALATLGVVPAVQASSGTWVGNGAWQTAANWVAGNISGATTGTTNTDTATFNRFNTNLTVTPDANRNLQSITFDMFTANYTIGTAAGNALLLTSGGTTQILNSIVSTNVTEAINAPIVLEGTNGTYTFANNSPTNGTVLNFGGGITGGAAGNTVLMLSGSNTNGNTISGIVADGSATSLGITKSGLGLWQLTGANTYSGTTTINGGQVTLSGTVGAGGVGGPLALGGGALYYSKAATSTQTFSSTAINAGSSAVTNSVALDTLALNAITRSVGATVDFTTTGAITTTTANTGTAILGGWATAASRTGRSALEMGPRPAILPLWAPTRLTPGRRAITRT